MALRGRLRPEDALVLVFALVSVLYPLIVALVIHQQEVETVSRVREVYSVLLGLSDCGRVDDVVPLLDPDLLRRIGGPEGVRRMCEEARRTGGEVSEVLVREGKRIFLRVKRDGLVLTLRAKSSGSDILVEDISYVQGSGHRRDLR
ncbi:MAG: hypothetical protein Q9N26_08825 [Aquificota bacterium]|nr:hypothetical protein [Aquificota bacterium]